MKSFLFGNETGEKGIQELEFIFNQIKVLGLNKAKLEFQVTLARGLSYYTGAIFEVLANNVKMGRTCGGGRYDNLTELFGVANMSGVGISFGADRIFDVMEMLDLFPKEIETATRILFINFGEIAQAYCLKLAKEYRDMGISVEVYPENAKMKKQMKYANDKNIPMVLLLGDNEINKGEITYKLMDSWEQYTVSNKAFKSLIQTK